MLFGLTNILCGQMAQRLVWSFFVVLFKPQVCLFTHFRQALKHKHTKHCLTVAAVESFDESILHRPPRLDELEEYVMLFSQSASATDTGSGRYLI